MKKYNNYKQTFVDWIGEIPEQWEVKPLRAVLQQRNEKNDPIKTEQILSLSIADGVTLYSHVGRGGNKSKGDLTAYKIAHEGDIVMNSMNVIVGAVGLSRYFGAISPVYYALFPKDDSVEIKYYENIFKSKAFQKFLMVYGKGILIKKSASGKLNTIRMKVSSTDLRGTYLPVPAYVEQVAIGQALDEFGHKIDEVIERKRKYLSVLKDYKQLRIDELVTKGTNSKVIMKDSKIEWLGMIPEKWDLKRLKLLLKKPLQYGANESGEKSANNSLRYIRITDFSNDNKLSDTNKLYLPIEKGINYKLSENDLLFARSGATAGKVFICSNLLEESCFAGYLIRAVVNSDIIIPKYLYYFMHSSAYYNWISYTFIKSTIENISATKYESLNIPIPTINEQKNIMQIIDDIEIKYKKILLKVEQQIELLQQYRQSLIYELVTGKRKP